MIQTKTFYTNDFSEVARGMESFSDLGYSLAIPWLDVTTSGWSNMDPRPMKTWGTENKLILRDDPEYYAAGDLIRSNIIPAINLNDPIYHFSREDYTYKLW